MSWVTKLFSQLRKAKKVLNKVGKIYRSKRDIFKENRDHIQNKRNRSSKRKFQFAITIVTLKRKIIEQTKAK